MEIVDFNKVLSKLNHAKKTAPIRIMQFGEGNFLRAFVDWMIQKMNDSKLYNGHVVVVQPQKLSVYLIALVEWSLYDRFNGFRQIHDIIHAEELHTFCFVHSVCSPL